MRSSNSQKTEKKEKKDRMGYLNKSDRQRKKRWTKGNDEDRMSRMGLKKVEVDAI